MRNNPSPRGVTLFKNLQTALSRYGWLVVLALACVPVAGADESLAGLACRSVHLGYDGQAGVAFTSEVIVERSAPGAIQRQETGHLLGLGTERGGRPHQSG